MWIYIGRSCLCILLRCGFFKKKLFAFYFFFSSLIMYVHIIIVCKLEIWNWNLKRKGKPHKKKTFKILSLFWWTNLILQKKKDIFRKKIKMNQFIIKTVISIQTKEFRIACGYLGDSFVMNQSKTSFRRPRRSPFVFFGFNKVAARKSTRKITGKNLNAKLIKKETNLNLKHCFAKVQS